MTPCEFKAWFAGYAEHIAEAPTAEQWTRITTQVGALYDPLNAQRLVAGRASSSGGLFGQGRNALNPMGLVRDTDLAAQRRGE